MKIELVNRLVMFVSLLVVQVLILNHVHLLGVGTPLLYVYFAITFRRNFPKWLVLVSCFMLGLLIDIFSNTPGLASSVMTLAGLAQCYLMNLIAPRDSAEDLEASSRHWAIVSLPHLADCLLCSIVCCSSLLRHSTSLMCLCGWHALWLVHYLLWC